MSLRVSYNKKNMKKNLNPESHWREESDPELDPDL